MEELSDWFKERGYEESFVQQHIGRVWVVDRETPTRDSDKQKSHEREDRAQLVPTHHPTLSSMIRVVQKLHPMLKSTAEHRKASPEPTIIAFRWCKNLKRRFGQVEVI